MTRLEVKLLIEATSPITPHCPNSGIIKSSRYMKLCYAHSRIVAVNLSCINITWKPDKNVVSTYRDTNLAGLEWGPRSDILLSGEYHW